MMEVISNFMSFILGKFKRSERREAAEKQKLIDEMSARLRECEKQKEIIAATSKRVHDIEKTKLMDRIAELEDMLNVEVNTRGRRIEG